METWELTEHTRYGVREGKCIIATFEFICPILIQSFLNKEKDGTILKAPLHLGQEAGGYGRYDTVVVKSAGRPLVYFGGMVWKPSPAET